MKVSFFSRVFGWRSALLGGNAMMRVQQAMESFEGRLVCGERKLDGLGDTVIVGEVVFIGSLTKVDLSRVGAR